MFDDRTDAGKKLGKALSRFQGKPVVVYALPRGGVVLGVEVARELGAPLDLVVVRKIGHPMQPEYAIGAVTEDGDVVLNPEESSALDAQWLNEATQSELLEARRRRALYLRGHPETSVKGKIAIVVDDGLATGLTMEAAARQLRKRHPDKVVIAVPVAALETVARLRSKAGGADEIVTLYTPEQFGAVGAFYRRFNQVSDDEVIALMKKSQAD
jgi:predicted phosphoribosyltransferase